MSATIKYKGNVIASINTDTAKTLKTSGKYCEADIIVENRQDGGITPSGNIALSPTTSEQTGINVSPYATASVAAITKELLATLNTDFKAENIAKDVDLFGLIGTHEGGGGGDVEIATGEFTPTSKITVGSSISAAYYFDTGLGYCPAYFFFFAAKSGSSAASTFLAERWIPETVSSGSTIGYATSIFSSSAKNAYLDQANGANIGSWYSYARIGKIALKSGSTTTTYLQAGNTYKWIAIGEFTA